MHHRAVVSALIFPSMPSTVVVGSTRSQSRLLIVGIYKEKDVKYSNTNE